ncbi:MAG: DegT/DnrJ/EryC1/StrS family aminotransferase [Kiritimatiellaeota bacterium]|nr:DegT/DnrJ/EryC1/StrS family aminotransferase [Kiritimatiellota bacterium]
MAEVLAALGGAPALGKVKPVQWPPRYRSTERELLRLYRQQYWSFNGPQEKLFCAKFAAFQGAKHCVFMMNGTVTLEAALYVLGIGRGDEVIVPAITWVATAAAVVYVGAKPVFVDVDPETLCMDPVQVEAAITPQTRAIIPVHLYGAMADLDALQGVATRRNLSIIEDCAHAHGGAWAGNGAGTLGRIGSFSFQESKPLACGEGGAVITDDEELASRLYRYKHIGYPPGPRPRLEPGQRYSPPGFVCRNYRATEFQAVILLGQMRTLRRNTARRAVAAEYLRAGLEEIPGVRVQSPGRRADPQAYYRLVVTFQPEELAGASQAAIIRALAAEGLPTGPLYGTVYRHPLWNVAPENWRMVPTGADKMGECCAIAEDLSTRSIGIPHQWLLQPPPVLDAIAGAFRKLYRNRDALRRLEE